MKQTTPFLKSGTFVRKKYDRILFAGLGAWIVTLIDSCADSVLAGVLLDETAVSAIALVQPISSVVSFLAYLISVGTAVMFSRESGAFHREKAYGYVGQGAVCSLGISALLVVSMLLLREPLMGFYNASAEITALARDYYMCEIAFAALYPIYFLTYQLVVVDGDEVCSFLACLAAALFNVAASLLLVGSLGVKGLALGTVIGTVVGILAYSAHFLRKKNSVRLRLSFRPRELWEVAKISSSTSMTLLYVAVIDIVMNKFVISVYGDSYLPAYTVVNFMLNLGAMFCCLYDACSGFIGVAYGEKNPAGIRQTMRVAYGALVPLSLGILAVLELLSPVVPELYGITDPAVRSASVFAARVISLSCPAMAVYYLFCNYYPIVGRVQLGHLLSILFMLISPLALAMPLGLAFGFQGLSLGFMLTSFVAIGITALVVRLKYGKGAVPLVLEETEEECISHELRLTEEGISALCERISAELKERVVDPAVTNEVQMILEESYLTVMQVNRGKTVLTQCDLLISPKALRLITRDNGKIFDITDENARVKDLRSYVLARLMERNPERTNTTTVSFNRNSYYWHLC